MFTSASSDTLDHIRSFSSQDGGVEVPLGFTGQGNLLIIVHHIRAIPLTRKAGVVRKGGGVVERLMSMFVVLL